MEGTYLREETEEVITRTNVAQSTLLTPVVQSISSNISHIIEDIKKQRLEVSRLNIELKNSKGLGRAQAAEESRSVKDLTELCRRLRREKEIAVNELRTTKEQFEMEERRTVDRDSVQRDLRRKNTELADELARKTGECESLKAALARSQNFSGELIKKEEEIRTLQASLSSASEKARAETKKAAQIQSDFDDLQRKHEILRAEHTEMMAKLEATRKKLLSGNEDLLRIELQNDLNTFRELMSGLEEVSTEIRFNVF